MPLASTSVSAVLGQQVVADWNELQHLSTALKQWRMLPDFSCLDEGTRIGAHLWCLAAMQLCRGYTMITLGSFL